MQAKILILPDCTGADLHRSLVEKKKKSCLCRSRKEKIQRQSKTHIWDSAKPYGKQKMTE